MISWDFMGCIPQVLWEVADSIPSTLSVIFWRLWWCFWRLKEKKITPIFKKGQEGTKGWSTSPQPLGRQWSKCFWKLLPNKWRSRRGLGVVSMDLRQGNNSCPAWHLPWLSGWLGSRRKSKACCGFQKGLFTLCSTISSQTIRWRID